MYLSSKNNPASTEGAFTSDKLLRNQIEVMHYLIEGHTFRAIMKSKSNLIQSETNADIVAVCLKQKQYLSIEFLGADRRRLLSYLKRFNINKNLIKFDNFLKHHTNDFFQKKWQEVS